MLRGARSSAGSAAAEFALCLPILVIFVVGGANYGFMAYQEAVLVAAARAGAEYASAQVRASTTNTRPSATAMKNHAALPTDASFGPLAASTGCALTDGACLAYACSGSMSTAIRTASSYGGNCGSGATEMDYIQVTAQIASYPSHSMLGSNLGIASFFIPSTLSATINIRVQ